METINWYHAAGYCNKLSELAKLTPCYTCTGTGKAMTCTTAAAYEGSKIYTCAGYRLPTEAEFEYAYRAGTTGFSFSASTGTCTGEVKEINDHAWYQFNSGKKTHTCKAVKPNPWGLYDMGGNLWEWGQDWLTVDLGSAPVTDPGGAATSSKGKVIRGGSWNNAPRLLRSANRSYVPITHTEDKVGLRCVRTLIP